MANLCPLSLHKNLSNTANRNCKSNWKQEKSLPCDKWKSKIYGSTFLFCCASYWQFLSCIAIENKRRVIRREIGIKVRRVIGESYTWKFDFLFLVPRVPMPIKLYDDIFKKNWFRGITLWIRKCSVMST